MTQLRDTNSPSSHRPSMRAGILDLLATGFYLGRVPVAPGTVGAVLGIPLVLALSLLASLWMQIVIIAALCVVGIPLCTAVARRMGKKDPAAIVWDEIASMPIAFFLVPLERLWSPAVLLVGFLLHRVFDISKPPPAGWLERLPDGLGIMADDWSAGVYSCIVLHVLLWYGVFT